MLKNQKAEEDEESKDGKNWQRNFYFAPLTSPFNVQKLFHLLR